MNKTSIEWTDFSANPIKYRRKSDGKTVWACVKTSPGCAYCYSEAIALRWDRGKLFNAANMQELEPYLDEAECHKMRTAKRIGGFQASGSACFIGDMTDIMGEWVPDELLNRLFSSVLEVRTDVRWQILTKRAERLGKYIGWRWGEGRIPARNVHLGVSAEDQLRANERVPHLLACPAAVRFLSIEPMIGPVDLTQIATKVGGAYDDALNGRAYHTQGPESYGGPTVDWVIVGGESGLHSRDHHIEHGSDIVEQCRAAGVPVFRKQLGSVPLVDYYADEPIREWALSGRYEVWEPCQGGWMVRTERDRYQPPHGTVIRVRLKDPKGGDWNEWPEELRVREFPKAMELAK